LEPPDFVVNISLVFIIAMETTILGLANLVYQPSAALSVEANIPTPSEEGHIEAANMEAANGTVVLVEEPCKEIKASYFDLFYQCLDKVISST
jgi:hypothetical protein